MKNSVDQTRKQAIKGYQTILEFLHARLSRVQYIILSAVIVGVVSGLMAVLLKTAVHEVHSHVNAFSDRRLFFLLFPAAGLLLTTWVIHRFFKGHIEKGIAMVLKSIARRSAFIPSRNNYVHFITSALTVGFGGSAGLEAPIVATGSSLGSTMGRLGKLSYAERMLMIGCGAAAGIAAVYNAPIAGVIFAMEVLLADSMVSYFVPLIIAAVIGVLCSKILVGDANLFNFILKENFNYYNVPFYVVLGIGAGFLCLYYARAFGKVDKSIHAWKFNPYVKALIGGGLLALCFLIFAPLYGEGYASIKTLADGTPAEILPRVSWGDKIPYNLLLLGFTGCVLLLKPVAAAITIGSGGNGGNFAPSLFVGAFWGFFFSRLMNVTGWVHLPEGNFTLVGMAGVLSGVMYCPLTAIFLIAEITNGYGLFVPLMIVSSIAYFIVKQFEPYYMETKALALGGQIFTHKKEHNILNSIHVADVMKTGEKTLQLNDRFRQLLEVFRNTDVSNFAVVDEKKKLAGVIDLNDVRNLLAEPEKHLEVPVRQFMRQPAVVVEEGETMIAVMEKFDAAGAAYLPVVNEDKAFVSFVYKTALFEQYRAQLAIQKDIYEE
jgi:CIC family chloride channel protein